MKLEGPMNCLSPATPIDSVPLATAPGLPPSSEHLKTNGPQNPLCISDGVEWGLFHPDMPLCPDSGAAPVWIQRPGRVALEAASTFLVL